MINLKLEIINPFTDRFENIKCWAGSTFVTNKYWEIQLIKSNDIISFDLRISTQCSHAGVDIWLGLVGYSLNLQIYDSRHWNYEENGYY
jgi:hypothetical protein